LAVTQHETNFPKLRTDLTWTLHQFAQGASYTVSNPATGLNYQVGLAEYAFASLLDGETSVADAAAAMRALADRTGNELLAIEDSDGEMIASWLLNMKLATSDDQHRDATPARSKKTHFTALSVKMPLGDPGHFVAAISASFGWLATRIALVCYLVMIAVAAVQFACDLDRWSVALQPLADPSTWWIVGVVAVMLRVLHEAAHAVVSDRFDVKVGEIGILWILLMPLPYVDVSGCWQRNRRRERILIAGAGMLIEMVVAAIAVFIFSWSTSERMQHLAATVAMTASVVTVLFNANVLMRFDGYHMLVDVIGLPNLYADASSYWRGLASRIILGKNVSSGGSPPGWLGLFFRSYGLGIILWRVIVFVGLVLAAEHLFGGAGVLLAIAAVFGLLVRQLRGLPKWFAGARVLRASIGCLSAVAILCALWHLPIPFGEAETGVVRHLEPGYVRAGSDGFVRELLVERGDVVRRGEPLVTLENVALEHEVELLRLELATAELRHRRFLSEHEMASVEAQWSSVLQLRGQLAERREQMERLLIRADADGVVAALGDLSLWVGRYVHEGTELMRVVRNDEMEIVMLVDQESREVWSDRVNSQVQVKKPLDWEYSEAILSSVAPRATDRLPSESLGSHQGGSLAVRVSDSNDTVRLLRPRFEARVTPSPGIDLRDGQRVRVKLDAQGETIGQWISDSATDWLHSRLARHSLVHQLSSF
jgi:putative peptide zinc metalloprotease protein